MKGIKYIISKEKPETKSVRLYSEGLFYRAYEYSAYLFVHHIKEYQLRKKHFKNIDKEVVSIGFPKNILESILEKDMVVEQEENAIVLYLDKEVDSIAYEEWRGRIPLLEKKGVASKSSPVVDEVEAKVLDLVRTFRIENKTPMECMLFIAELKTVLNNE